MGGEMRWHLFPETRFEKEHGILVRRVPLPSPIFHKSLGSVYWCLVESHWWLPHFRTGIPDKMFSNGQKGWLFTPMFRNNQINPSKHMSELHASDIHCHLLSIYLDMKWYKSQQNYIILIFLDKKKSADWGPHRHLWLKSHIASKAFRISAVATVNLRPNGSYGSLKYDDLIGLEFIPHIYIYHICTDKPDQIS